MNRFLIITHCAFRMRKDDEGYKKGFQDELDSFIGRVKERAQARIDKAMKEYEEVSRIF